jgi:sodium pump decarboxylase gamma subunit
VANLEIGVALTVIGLGLVFAVLGLVALTIVMLVKLTAPETPRREAPPATAAEAPQPAPAEAAPASSSGLEPEEVAAIAAAVRLHQMVRRLQAAPAMRAHQPGSLPSRWLMAGRTRQTRSWERRG